MNEMFGDSTCLNCGLYWADSMLMETDKTECPRCGSFNCKFTPITDDFESLFGPIIEE